jgi:cyclic pyranopterin monophosphate synthase
MRLNRCPTLQGFRKLADTVNHSKNAGLTHVDQAGTARMVDVGGKPVTRRTATASAVCCMQSATSEAIRQNVMSKGDVLGVARLAAVLAAKRTDELIPLCHSLPLDSVDVDFQWLDETRLKILVTASVTGRTGVEMEAMVGASVAGLTIYDMCKSIDRTMTIQAVVLEAKSGGTSGEFRRPATEKE